MEDAKRSILIFLPWMIADLGIYVVASMRHLWPVEVAAFFALFLTVLFFVLSYRSAGAEQRVPTKYGARISAWASILAASLYLALSGMWR
jgi:hypothetical protein